MSNSNGIHNQRFSRAVLENMLPELRRYIRSIVVREDRVEDLLHDTIVTALSRMDEFRLPFRLLPWLMTIARNKSISYLRKENRFISLDDHPQLLGKIELMELSDENFTGDARDSVVRGMAELSSAMQDVLRMKYFSNMPIQQIGRVLNLPEGTVKRRLFEARKRLRKEMDMMEDPGQIIYPDIKIKKRDFQKIIRRRLGYGLCFGAPVMGVGDFEICDMYEFPGPVLSYRARSVVMRKGSILGRDVLEVRNDYEKTETMDTRLMYFSIADSTIEMAFRIFNETPDLRIDLDPEERMPAESLIIDTSNSEISDFEIVDLEIGTTCHYQVIKECTAYDDFHGNGYTERFWSEDGREVFQRNYIGENWKMGDFVSYDKLAHCPEIMCKGRSYRRMDEFILIEHS